MLAYFKREKVLSISLILAVLSAFIIHPDKQYVEYIDVRVLALLFCLMLLIKGFQSVGLFDILIQKLFGKVTSSRRMSQLLILLCFFSSMLITNDVSLITFVPFAIMALRLCHQEKLMIPVIVLQTIAANLGSMATPIGNPQNLYLFSASSMSLGSFFRTMLPLILVSLVLLLAATFLLSDEEIHMELSVQRSVSCKTSSSVNNTAAYSKPHPDRIASAVPGEMESDMNKRELIVYSLLFLLNLLVVFRILEWLPALIITVAGVLLLHRQELLKQVDYTLLATFVGFFIFVCNLGRISWFSQLLQSLLSGREILVSALLSQVLSNVPAALLLSGFTGKYNALLAGVNIGGLGTLIASMASLISYKLYMQETDAQTGKYFRTFTLYNVIAFVILLVFALIIY